MTPMIPDQHATSGQCGRPNDSRDEARSEPCAEPRPEPRQRHFDIDSPQNQERRRRGLDVMAAIDGDRGRAVMDSLADISPALAHHILAFGFGDVYDRPGLDARSRQLVTLGALTALGGCEAQLRVHVGASLNVGLTREEVVEVMLHAAVYCGFPRALNATLTAREVFRELDDAEAA